MDVQLDELRKQIDTVDNELFAALVKRFSLVEKVGAYKKIHAQPIVDENREEKILTRLKTAAKEHAISPEFIEQIWKTIIQEAYTREK